MNTIGDKMQVKYVNVDEICNIENLFGTPLKKRALQSALGLLINYKSIIKTCERVLDDIFCDY